LTRWVNLIDIDRKWKYERPEARPPFEHFGTPVIDSNGTIYVGSSDSRVFAFSPEGALLWVFIGDPEEEAIIGSPSPGPNGLLYAPIPAGGLVALETSLQPEIRPWRDTVIVSGLPDRSFERLDFMGVGYDADTGIWRSLVQFNWPEIPGLVPRETILALPLAGSSEPPQEMDITVYPVLNRGLGLVTWQNQPPTAEEPLTTLHVGTETGIWVLLNLSWPPPEHGVMLQGPESGETNLKLFLTTEHESGISAVAAFDLNIPPSSQVLPLPPYSPPEFRVSWSGFDSDGQIAGYTVQVREGAEGEWRDWVENTTVEAAQFAGEHGQTYGFRVRCWDNDGAMEPYWLIEDTQTTIDGIAPTAEISPLPEAQERTWWIVSWSGSDDLSGVAGYQVQVQEGDGPWRLWIQDTAFTQALFVSRQPGTRYAFRVRARDRAGNWGAWTPDEAAVTVSGADPSGLFTAELPLIRR